MKEFINEGLTEKATVWTTFRKHFIAIIDCDIQFDVLYSDMQVILINVKSSAGPQEAKKQTKT